MGRGDYQKRTKHPVNLGRGGAWRQAVIGISIFHTVGDRDRAVEQVNTDLNILVSELLGKTGADPNAFKYDPGTMARDPVGYAQRVKSAYAKLESSPLYPIWRDQVAPFYDAWNAFYADQSSWEQWKTNWEEYEHWVDRLNALRNAVQMQLIELGTSLQGPASVSLEKTIPGAVIDTTGHVIKTLGQGAATAAKDTWSMVRIGIYGGLAIGGIIALSSIVQQLRKDKDPLESYAELARRGYGTYAGRR